MAPSRALVLCIALLGSVSWGQKAPALAESGTDLVAGLGSGLDVTSVDKQVKIFADGTVNHGGRRLSTGCGPLTLELFEQGVCDGDNWRGFLNLRSPTGINYPVGGSTALGAGSTACNSITPPVIVEECGTWTVTYDLSGERDISFTINLGTSGSSILVSVDRRSGDDVSGRGFPPSGEFTFILADGPRITVEDFADGSTGRDDFQCPSFARWFGTLMLTDPNGEKHYFGRGLDLDLAMPGESFLTVEIPGPDILRRRSHVKTCAELELQGQSLPSVCGTWQYAWAFTELSAVQNCVRGGFLDLDPCDSIQDIFGDPDLGFVIKVDGVEEVSVGRKPNGDGSNADLTGSGSFSAPCEPSSQPSGQPTEQPSDQPSPAPSNAPTPCHPCTNTDDCYKCEVCNFEAEGGSGRQLRFGYSKTGCCHLVPGCLEK